MSKEFDYLPMVKIFILENMPNGGTNFVSNKLKNIGKSFTPRQIYQEFILLKKKPDLDVLYHSCMVLKENSFDLDVNCQKFVDNYEKVFVNEKAG